MCFGSSSCGLCSASGLEKQKKEIKKPQPNKQQTTLNWVSTVLFLFLLIAPFGIYALIEEKQGKTYAPSICPWKTMSHLNFLGLEMHAFHAPCGVELMKIEVQENL